MFIPVNHERMPHNRIYRWVWSRCSMSWVHEVQSHVRSKKLIWAPLFRIRSFACTSKNCMNRQTHVVTVKLDTIAFSVKICISIPVCIGVWAGIGIWYKECCEPCDLLNNYITYSASDHGEWILFGILMTVEVIVLIPDTAETRITWAW